MAHRESSAVLYDAALLGVVERGACWSRLHHLAYNCLSYTCMLPSSMHAFSVTEIVTAVICLPCHTVVLAVH